jgi:tetratricopeptide (TPR) repeat protein
MVASPMKVAVYAIALNEAKFAERFMTACRDADLVLVADTGSSDETPELLARLGADVRPLHIAPWRFDAARNAALALLPDDVDACVSLDLDQTPAPGWRDLLERAWRGEVNQLCYSLIFRTAGESGEHAFQDNRIHARRGFTWRYPCHEALVTEGAVPARPATELGLRILHDPDDAKPRTGYLPLLELAAREAPDDPRCAHYLGRELYYAGRYAEGMAELERFFALPPGRSMVERNASLRLLAHCQEGLGDGAGALARFQQAAQEAPRLQGAWVSLAWAYFRRQDWAECLATSQRAIAFPYAVRDYGDDISPGVVPEDMACLAAWGLGRPREALAFARAALAKAPASPRILANVERIEAALQNGARSFGVSMTPLEET